MTNSSFEAVKDLRSIVSIIIHNFLQTKVASSNKSNKDSEFESIVWKFVQLRVVKEDVNSELAQHRTLAFSL